MKKLLTNDESAGYGDSQEGGPRRLTPASAHRHAGSESLAAEVLQELRAEDRGERTTLDMRNLILGSLRDQFRTKVYTITANRVGYPTWHTDDPEYDKFLADLANNIAQGLAGDK